MQYVLVCGVMSVCAWGGIGGKTMKNGGEEKGNADMSRGGVV